MKWKVLWSCSCHIIVNLRNNSTTYSELGELDVFLFFLPFKLEKYNKHKPRFFQETISFQIFFILHWNNKYISLCMYWEVMPKQKTETSDSKNYWNKVKALLESSIKLIQVKKKPHQNSGFHEIFCFPWVIIFWWKYTSFLVVILLLGQETQVGKNCFSVNFIKQRLPISYLGDVVF